MGGEGEPVVVAEWLRKVLESERVAPPVMEWVMCSTCCGFVWRKKRRSAEVDEMLADVRLMRAAVMMPELHETLDDEGPDAAVKKQLEILLRRRRKMMERKRCPTCFRSLLDMPEPQPYEEDKAMVADAGSKKMAVGDETMAADAGSNKKNKRSEEEEEEEGKKKNKRSKEGRKKKNKRSMEEPRCGEKRKMVASEGEAMVVDLGSSEDSEYSMGLTGKSSSESSNQYSMGPTGKSSSESSNKYSMGPTGKSSSESSNKYSMGPTGKSSSESSEYSIGLTGKSSSVSSGEYSMGQTGKRRTKMVTCRLSKEFVQEFIQTHPPIRPFPHSTIDHIEKWHARQFAEYEVECEVHEYWKRECDIKGYVEYQEEVTDNEDA